MKNVIKTIDVKSNENLFRVACAMGEFQLMRKLALDNGAEEPKSIKFAMDSIMEVLCYKFQQLFIEEFPQYAENKMAFGENSKGFKIKVFEENTMTLRRTAKSAKSAKSATKK